MNIKFKRIKTVGLMIIMLGLFTTPFLMRHEIKGTSIEFHEQRGRWLAIINDERRKEERPLYLVEDCKPNMFKPERWDDFFVLSSLPEGYILYNLDLEGNYGSEEVAISYIFCELKNSLNVFGEINEASQFKFTQSKYKVHYIPIIQTDNIEDIAENTYYYRKWKDENMIYWRNKDMLLCIQGKMMFGFLESMANEIKEY